MLLDVSGLSIAYKGLEALHGVSLHIEEGELVSVIGANGAGKTTLLQSLIGWQQPSGGIVSFNGRDITGERSHIRARLGIRIVPEKARVFTRLTVHENLMMGAYGMSGRREKMAVRDSLRRLYSLFPVLERRSGQLASTLSGGEQQQLSIARACISAPKLLLVDEVSMGLMPILVDQVFELLAQLNREEGLTILLVEQNALASLKISHRAYVLETGDIVLEGEADRMLNDERIREAYLGI
ncbi:MAG: ABC transporter ATP-binding protein [Synergistaceae bacterium]|jgi:branched-chain amino acid transport system ATP-binding protein|nr:ABC transporter ATP-binding protein [Synergistaceae bacterium]